MTEPQAPTIEAARHALPPGLIHDLRTPLNHIIGYSALLMEQAQEQGQDGFVPDLQKTQTAGLELLGLIDEHFHAVCVLGTPAVPSALHPLEQEQGTEESPEEPAIGELAIDASQAYVLVVDDIEANREVLSRRLKHQGYAVATAENGRQALEKVHAANFDLVLLDIMMPEMDGYEVLRRLKADPVSRPIPVIMISALNELDSVIRCIEMGAEDYLPKPFNPTLLKARTGACLEKKRARDREILAHQRVQELATALHVQNNEMARWRKAHEADLAIARTTQQGIVNSALPQFDGWQVESVYTPLIQVGGDVYGWRQLDRGAWLFWLADATGHGVSAALFTTLVALLFDHASAASKSAHTILSHVNAEFYSVLRGHSFMTACCSIIEADGKLTFAGAGHPPLLIRRRDESVEALPSLNTMMGLNPSMQIDETVTMLASGDVALIYTDGLHSLKSDGGERFTNEAVADAFAQIDASADLIPRLIEQLVQRSNAQPFDDDFAAIALRRG